ncbi:gamma-glutamyl-gamma-aminobutyrate hydrolase family protein [Ornithinibacillus sp. BX22]|uniref:Gamma-glutamyl-gamma-aminobutyrate hydrolase family protein n=1 Tax=Ornithinibacillus hominis TaxID=2763055 RepID=A0A923RJ55_9BACI|nr:gamma-glutamyl-gamma-aminobutyrate hydrolase family protein [Ornithinibacillus hominis]MBC5637715.1 gamma-glutamyl-gamma-aminobutyrate hydrolase family protein [Ornithinibacillus hominis]
MKPLIGVITSTDLDGDVYYEGKDNVNAILKAGGVPILLPYYEQEEDLTAIAGMIDGLYATGGYDIDPTLFGEEPHPNLGTILPERDTFEISIMKKMLELEKPILGVCRGSQTLNIALGGDMYQDIYAQIPSTLLQHRQNAPKYHGSHFVEVKEGSLLHRLTGETKLRVNSRHHQANRNVPNPLQISATASDGVIEAIESTEHQFALALQWHPENMFMANDTPSAAIFKGFISACKQN